MMPIPPRGAERVLRRALRRDPAGPAILGDLHEDFVARAARGGAASARRWYWREALLLAMGRGAQAVPQTLRKGMGAMKGMQRPRGLGHDVATAVRAARRAPGTFVLLALVIALGVGATTTVYSVLRPLLLAPLPFEDAASLVWIENMQGGASLSAVTSRSGNLRDFRLHARSFDGLTGYNAFFDQAAYTLLAGGTAEQLMGVGVAHDFLDVLGVTPAVGRGFTVEEGVAGGPAAIVLTNGYWRRRFAADAGVVGSTLTIDGVPREVVGVLPATFDFSSVFTPGVPVDFLLPFPVGEPTDGQGNTMFFIGRLGPGVTVAAAQAELDGIVAALQSEQPDRWGLGARLEPLQAHIAGPFRPALLLLAAAAAAVMLIVCFNVANVLLARSPGRGREVAVRKALGATRGRIVRQLVLESLLLALAGGVGGVLLSLLATRWVSGMVGVDIPLLERVGVDGSALAFALVAATAAGLLAGIAPALQVSEGRESDTLRAASRGASGHRAGRRLRELLVVGELTVACVLLVAGGLLLRSFRAVLDVDLGYEAENAVAWQLQPSLEFETVGEEARFYAEVVARLRALPGVESAGLIDALPLGRNRNWGFRVVGAPEPADGEGRNLFPHMIDPGYLETMRIPIVEGRGITSQDTHDAPSVVLINETAAATLFPGERALGRRVLAAWGRGEQEIVGIVADVRHVTPERGPGIQVYMPMAQVWDYQSMDLVVRSRLPLAALTAAVSSTLSELDPAMPTHDYWTLQSTLDRAVSPRRFTLHILGGFGLSALLLAALGIYGVLSQSVAERAREIGIRMTLGASAGSVRGAVVGRTLLLAAAGIGAGLVIALAGTRLLASLLYGVSPADPVTLAAMSGVLLGVAALSGLLPALRASRTDALAVLRGE